MTLNVCCPWPCCRHLTGLTFPRKEFNFPSAEFKKNATRINRGSLHFLPFLTFAFQFPPKRSSCLLPSSPLLCCPLLPSVSATCFNSPDECVSHTVSFLATITITGPSASQYWYVASIAHCVASLIPLFFSGFKMSATRSSGPILQETLPLWISLSRTQITKR